MSKYEVSFPVDHGDDGTSYLPIGTAETLTEARAVIAAAQAEDAARIAAGTLQTFDGQPWDYAVREVGKPSEVDWRQAC